MNTKHYLSRFMQRAAVTQALNASRAAMLLLVMLLTATTAWAQDVVEAINGLTYNTAGGYYEINDWQDLIDLATYVNGGHNAEGKTFKVTQDIVFTHTTAWNNASSTENNYTPIGGYIGDSFQYFKGYFDGQGHTVSGIRIYNGAGEYQGLFGYVYGTAEVKNVILADARITGYDCTGGIAGRNNGKITNCHVLSDVTIHTIQDDCHDHGGIVGYNSGGTVTGCTSAASITTAAGGSANGGIAGTNSGGTIKDCLYLGNTVESNTYVGAIVGHNSLNSSTVQNSYYTSTTIKGKDKTGNILDNANSAVGYNNNGTVTNCGLVSSDDIAQSGDTYTIGTTRGWDTFCGMLYHNNTYNRFSGKTVKLGASISVTRMAGGDYHDFCGTFDGNQKTLTVSYGSADSPINENNVAPFRNLQSYCIIKDLHVAGDIYTSGQFAGGLAGTMFGTVEIENCLVSTVIHSYTSGDGTHGGIVGHAGNNSTTNLTIEGCAFNGKLLTCGETETTSCSGFVGYKHSNGTVSITNSFYAPAALGTGETEITSGSATFMRGGSVGTNCYYTRTLGDAQGNASDGPCGTNVYYAYNSSTKTLNIFGTGAMTDYSYGNAPWYNYHSDITSVVIGNGVTSIGNYAFYNCNGLTSITIPNGVTSIGNEAFYNCTVLTDIEIPATVESIGVWAFEYCNSLTSIEIPASVTSIGLGAFADCTSLASISVTSGNSTYHSDGNCIIETATKTLIAGCKNSVIPTGVTSIGERAFSGCTGLTSITIPNSVTSIGNYAFDYCTSLTSIEIPASVTSIGDNAFDHCTALASITIPNGVTSIGNEAFYNCTALTSIEIPASVTSIGSHAFEGSFSNCSSLASVTIYAPKLDKYGKDAFNYNASGRKIYVYYDCVETYKGAANWSSYAGDILPITLSANAGDNAGEYWTTYYNDLAHAKVPEGAQAFKVTLTGTTLALTPISDGIITKGTGVVIKSTSNSILPESSASASSDTNANSLTGTMKTITNPGNAYVLSKKGDNGVGFYRLKDTGTIGAHKAYLTYSGTSAPEFLGFGDETAIENVTNSQQPANNEYYDLQGRKVTNPTKGLYIVNGKKVVIKR